MRTRSGPLPALLGAIALMAAAALLFTGPAQAAEVANHPFLPKRFHQDGSPLSGAFTPAHNFEDACGIAVDSQGDIYVADYYHHAIDVLDEDGGYVTQIAAVDPLDGPCGLAVDAAGNVYVNDYHRDVVKYVPSAYPYDGLSSPPTYSGPAPIDSGHPTGLALDPASGDLYVDDRTHVAVYDAPVKSGSEPAATIGLGAIGDGYGLAVSAFAATRGRLYVADAATDTVKVFDPAVSLASPVAEIDAAGAPQGGFVSLVDSSLALDQSNGHLFVSDNSQPGFEHPAAAIDEFGATGLYRDRLGHALLAGEPVGIAVDESTAHRGDVYVTSGNGSADVFPKVPNSEESVVYAFGPAGALEVAQAGAGEGTATANPAGIACGESCAAEHDAGARVTLITAAASPPRRRARRHHQRHFRAHRRPPPNRKD